MTFDLHAHFTRSRLRFEIKPSYACNRKCPYCQYISRHNDKGMNAEEVVANYQYLTAKYGDASLTLSGGEFLARSDALPLLSNFLSQRVKTIEIHTNGFVFADEFIPNFVQTIEHSRSNIILLVSFHEIMHKGRRAELTLIRESIPDDVCIGTNTLITRRNLIELACLGEFASSIGLDYTVLTYPFPMGLLERSYTKYTPVIDSDFLGRVEAFLSDDTPTHKYVQGIPRCTLPGWSEHFIKPCKQVLIDKAHQFENHTYITPFDHSLNEEKSVLLSFSKIQRCATCTVQEQCDGLWTEYYRQGYYPFLAR
jgi:MoaA/NifB/PqqE/SkfB family radical SAM enzyme